MYMRIASVKNRIIELALRKRSFYLMVKVLLYARGLGVRLGFVNIIKKRRFCREAERRKKISFFDYNLLSKDFTRYIPEYFPENCYYGNNWAVRKAMNNSAMLFGTLIEHGYYWGNYVPKASLLFDTIVTFGEQRVKHINSFLQKRGFKGQKIKVITIGPYINYAEGIMTNSEKKDIQKKYGKILLVFPSHSIEGVIYEFNINDFISEINKVKGKFHFDNVFICMYWKDVLDKRYIDDYERNRFKIITAGHINDPNFLSRLKDIIDVSNMTMSNFIGTHIGYCLARGKPHYLFYQSQVIKGRNVDLEFRDRKSKEHVESLIREHNEIIEAFSVCVNRITEKQTRVYKKYWGGNDVKCYFLEKRGG
ncbi:MAG: hypothetical protein PWQ70_2953 [Clostridiales bacterium]|jgi:hypothetical protein|nr:hypothetical protein [Clostridiales bacterium]